MKRHGNLWNNIIDEENIVLAAKKAMKGKRSRENVIAFNAKLGDNIVKIKKDLETKNYKPGSYRTFEIFEPKKRMISAAPLATLFMAWLRFGQFTKGRFNVLYFYSFSFRTNC